VKHGRLDDDALAFAIYTPDGKMVLNDGENGRDIPYHYRRDGFDNGQLKDDKDEWRFLWLTSPDGKYRVVVGRSGNTARRWRWISSAHSSRRGWWHCP
jgi:two-component system sensor histidine kinase QseC